MHFMTVIPAVAFVMYHMQKVYLLLNDIVVVAVESDERCLVRECIELCSAFQNYTTVISSMETHANKCVVLIIES